MWAIASVFNTLIWTPNRGQRPLVVGLWWCIIATMVPVPFAVVGEVPTRIPPLLRPACVLLLNEVELRSREVSPTFCRVGGDTFLWDHSKDHSILRARPVSFGPSNSGSSDLEPLSSLIYRAHTRGPLVAATPGPSCEVAIRHACYPSMLVLQ